VSKDKPREISDRPGTPSDDSGFDDGTTEALRSVAPVNRLPEIQKRYATPSTSINSRDAPTKSALLTPSSAPLPSQPADNSSRQSVPDVVPIVRQDSSDRSFVRPSADGVDRPELVCPVCNKPVKTPSELK
jgi:hypothetical protein